MELNDFFKKMFSALSDKELSDLYDELKVTDAFTFMSEFNDDLETEMQIRDEAN